MIDNIGKIASSERSSGAGAKVLFLNWNYLYSMTRSHFKRIRHSLLLS